MMAVRSALHWVALKVESTVVYLVDHLVVCWVALTAVMMVDYDGEKG